MEELKGFIESLDEDNNDFETLDNLNELSEAILKSQPKQA